MVGFGTENANNHVFSQLLRVHTCVPKHGTSVCRHGEHRLFLWPERARQRKNQDSALV